MLKIQLNEVPLDYSTGKGVLSHWAGILFTLTPRDPRQYHVYVLKHMYKRMQLLVEFGIYSAWREWNQRLRVKEYQQFDYIQEVVRRYDAKPKKLTLGLNILTIFVIWSVGLLISTSVLSIELARKRYTKLACKYPIGCTYAQTIAFARILHRACVQVANNFSTKDKNNWLSSFHKEGKESLCLFIKTLSIYYNQTRQIFLSEYKNYKIVRKHFQNVLGLGIILRCQRIWRFG